jgi:hypothetical protein
MAWEMNASPIVRLQGDWMSHCCLIDRWAAVRSISELPETAGPVSLRVLSGGKSARDRPQPVLGIDDLNGEFRDDGVAALISAV